MHATNSISIYTHTHTHTHILGTGYKVNCRNSGLHYHRHIHTYILWHSGNEDHLKLLTMFSEIDSGTEIKHKASKI